MIRSGAAGKLTELAEKLEIPVVTSLLGKELSRNHIPGAFAGMAGMHGHPVANRALMTADVILAIGSVQRQDDRKEIELCF